MKVKHWVHPPPHPCSFPLPCSLFSWPYAAHPLSCTTNLPPHPWEWSHALLKCTLVYRAETQSHLSCGCSPQVYNPCRIGYERTGEESTGGCKKEGKTGVLTCTMCASGSALTVKEVTGEKAGEYKSNACIWLESFFFFLGGKKIIIKEKEHSIIGWWKRNRTTRPDWTVRVNNEAFKY